MGSEDLEKSNNNNNSNNGGVWGIAKKVFLLLSIGAVGVNVWTLKRMQRRFISDVQELQSLKDATLSEENIATLEEEDVVASGSGDVHRVLKVLHEIEKLESTIIPPPDKNLVVVLGKSFILKRDFEIWDYTFSAAKMEVMETTKQDLQSHKVDDQWAVMKCLDLFDGKSHCIEPGELPGLQKWQRISRLFGLRKTLWNKDKFCETMSSALKGFDTIAERDEFVFPCWILPAAYDDLMKDAKTKYVSRSFILKPTDRGEGNGIIVMDHWRKLANWKADFPDNDEIVVQTYLPNPFLITQRKWDMRTYVLVTSIHPLRVYMFRDGLVRFASSKYEANAADGGKKTAFLTNTSVNKKTGAAVDDLTWPFPKVYDHLKASGGNPDELWEKIERTVVRVLMAAEPSFVRQFRKLQNDYTCSNCYQLLGVDVIVDDYMTPRVIEVNGEPSMQLSGEKGSHYDHTKKSMTHDLVAILFNRDSFARALTADLTALELEGFSIGYQALGCSTSDDICLQSLDLQYLLGWKREQQNIGGFRRIYPHKTGDFYTKFLVHLESKMPYGTLTSTNRLHKLLTALEMNSNVESDNGIEDKSYLRGASADEGDDDEEDES